LQRLVAVDLHSAAIEGFFAIPMEHLSAVSMLVEAARPRIPANAVTVAPDLGAVKLAERYARPLHLPIAIVHKTRVSGEEVSVRGIVGDIRNRAPLVVDDMISTGGTIEAAVRAILAAGCLSDVTVVTSHALLVGPAAERLRALPIRRLITTNSVAVPMNLPLPLQVASLAPLLAEAIARLHDNQSLSDLIVHG
jgi:ribose-phosphate pyrophosphokinase